MCVHCKLMVTIKGERALLKLLASCSFIPIFTVTTDLLLSGACEYGTYSSILTRLTPPAGQLRSRDFPGPIILRISTKHQFYMIEQPSHTVVVASRFEEHIRIENSTFI